MFEGASARFPGSPAGMPAPVIPRIWPSHAVWMVPGAVVVVVMLMVEKSDTVAEGVMVVREVKSNVVRVVRVKVSTGVYVVSSVESRVVNVVLVIVDAGPLIVVVFVETLVLVCVWEIVRVMVWRAG